MAISINPVLPVLAAQEAGGVAPELVLQPGSVVNAQVLKVLSADLVRIAIASLSIDVASEIPLQQGQNLQLAVIADQGRHPARGGRAGRRRGRHPPTPSRLSPDALVDAAANRPTIVAPKNVLTPLERAAVSAAAQTAATEQDSLAPLFANLGAAVSVQQSAAETAAGDRAGAGAADQPRSEPRRRRHQDGVPEIRDFPRGVAGGGLGPVERRSRSQGRADRAAPDAAIGARRQCDGRDADGAGRRRSKPLSPQTAAAEPCAVFVCPIVDVQEILLPQARLPVAEDLRATGQAAPQCAGGGARCRTARGRDPEPAAGSAAGARQPGAGRRHAERCPWRRHHRSTPTRRRRRFAARCRRRSRSHRPRSRRMRRSRPPRIICSTTPMPRLRGKPCCRWPRCRTVSTRRRRRST